MSLSAKGLSRRQLSKRLAGASVLTYGALHVPRAFGSPPPDYDGDCGVTSGSPRADGFVIWTRVPKANRPSNDTVSVRYQVATERTFASTSLVASGQVDATSERDFTVREKIAGLGSDAVYYYRFSTDTGYSSDVGRARTAPNSASRRPELSFAVVSCQAFSVGTYAAYRALASENADFAIHLGDHIYEKDGGRPNAPDPLGGHEALTLDDYRKKYRYYLSDPAWRAARSQFTWIDIWDDHEVYNDWAGPTNIGANKPRFSAGFEAFTEFMPIEASMTRPSDGQPAVQIYATHDFGPLLSAFALDQRQFRSIKACGTADFMVIPCAANADGGRSMLGTQQKAWFKNQLGASSARWQLVLSEVMVSPFKVPAPRQGATDRFARDLFHDRAGLTQDGYLLNLDSWDGFPAERRELLNFIADDRIKNVVFATGDIHSAYDSVIGADDAMQAGDGIAVEVVGSAISSWPLANSLRRAWGNDMYTILNSNNPQFRWTNVEANGYTVLRFASDAMTVEHVGVTTITDPASPCTVIWRSRVPSGRSEFV